VQDRDIYCVPKICSPFYFLNKSQNSIDFHDFYRATLC